MNTEQLAYFALLGADISNFKKYMGQCNNDISRSVKALCKYHNLSVEALDWLYDEGIADFRGAAHLMRQGHTW